MRASVVLAVLGATLALASPLHHQLAKKAIVTDWDTVIVYVTVTAGAPAPPPAATPPPSPPVYPVDPQTPAAPPAYPQDTPPAPPTYVQDAPPADPPAAAPAPAVSYPPVEQPVEQPPVEQPPVVQPVEQPAPAAAPAAPPVPPSPTDYASTGLYHHNCHRRNHTADYLSWDDTLAGYAKTIAEGCVFKHDMAQGDGGYGQNLAAYEESGNIDPSDFSPALANSITNMWYYGETANMPWGVDSPESEGVPEFLHLSQVLWKSTTHVGCYTAQCPAGTIFPYHGLYTVCNYKSAGNMMGSFSSEVTTAIGLEPIQAPVL